MNPTCALREYVRAHAEDRPGVYRLYGPGEELLYVGKSVRVRSRLLSYFRAPPEEKGSDIVAAAVRAEWENAPNEFLAVLLEMKLIQRHRPRFNVEHKRRPLYGFVKVTREAAPRVLAVTRVVNDGSVYYGPFGRMGRVDDAMRDLAQTLGLRDCPGPTPILFDDQLDLFAAPAGPARAVAPLCLRADLGSCLGPCCGRTSAAAYTERVRMASRFLVGGREALRLLEGRIAAAAARLDFEYAALVRDRLARLNAFREELTAFRGEVDGLTFIYRVPGFRGDDRIYLIRRGRVRAELPHPKGKEARATAARTVEEVYGAGEPGVSGLAPEDAAEVLLVARWFRQRPEERKRTFGPREWLARAGPVTPPPRARTPAPAAPALPPSPPPR